MNTRAILNWIGFLAVAFSLAVAPTTQPAADSAPPPLTSRQQDLLLQLADAEANIQAINKALKVTGYNVGLAYGHIDSNLKGNELMDRKGGGPVRWDEFYGKTASAYADNATWFNRFGDHRPEQFNFVYKANNDQIARAKDQIASLIKNQQALLDRRHKHEDDQSRLWAILAWEQVKDREIEFRPLYRFALKPAGPEATVLGQLILFLRTADGVAKDGLASIETDQSAAFHAGNQRMDAAFTALQKSLADSLDAGNLKPDRIKQGQALKAICKQLAEETKVIADDYSNALDRDKAKEDNSKLEFRGQLQSSLSRFVTELGTLDSGIGQTANAWAVGYDKGAATRDAAQPSVAEKPPQGGHAAPPPEGSRHVDLLNLFDPATSAVQGTWHMQNGTLACDAATHCKVAFAYEPPDEYDFLTSFTTDHYHEGVTLICYGGGRQFVCEIGAFHNTIVGFGMVHGKDADKNVTAKRKNNWLTDGHHYTAIVKVRKTGVEAYLDGELVTGLNTDYSNLSLWHELRLPHQNVVGIRTQDDSLRFDKVEIIEITGQGKNLSAMQAAPTTATELQQRLAATKWEWPDRKIKNGAFTLNADGTITANWHKHPGVWVVKSRSSIEVVIKATDRTPVKCEVSWEPEIVIKAGDGDVYKQIKD